MSCEEKMIRERITPPLSFGALQNVSLYCAADMYTLMLTAVTELFFFSVGPYDAALVGAPTVG